MKIRLSQLARATIAFLLPVLASCEYEIVESIAPVGSEAVHLNPAKWNGVWHDGDESVYRLEVIDAAEGLIRISPGEDPEDQMLAHIRAFRNWHFVNIIEDAEEEDSDSRYSFGRVLLLKDELLIWWSNEYAFRDIRDEIPLLDLRDEGEDDPEWVLGALTEGDLLRLTQEPRERLFEAAAMRFFRVDPEAWP